MDKQQLEHIEKLLQRYDKAHTLMQKSRNWLIISGQQTTSPMNGMTIKHYSIYSYLPNHSLAKTDWTLFYLNKNKIETISSRGDGLPYLPHW